MQINSFNNQNTFKAISINPRIIGETEPKIKELAEKSINQINQAIKEGALKDAVSLSTQLNDITVEMNIRRKIEGEKPWYKAKHYNKIDKMEAEQKQAAIRKQAAIIAAAEKEYEGSGEIQNKYSQNVTTTNKKEAKTIFHYKFSNTLEALRAKLSNNTKGFQRIAGYSNEKNILDKYFISEIKKEQAGEKANVPNCVLFFGPTGNGKTTFARAFAAETGCKLELGRSSKDFIEMLETKMQKSQELFQKKNIRTVLFIDEFDKEAQNNPAVILKLKEILPICSKKYNCTIFATTNDPLNIELQLSGKDGLFPYIVSIDPPNLQNKIDVLEYYLKERKNKNIDYNKLANLLEEKEKATGQRYNIAQIKEICLSIQDNELSEQQIINTINKTEPTIDKKAMSKYQNEMNTLITNEVKN